MNLGSESGLISGGMPEIRYPPGVEAAAGDKSPSPVSEFIADEEAASICPLLTPSPPATFEHPLALINAPPGMAYERQISPSSTDPELSALPMNGGTAYVGLNIRGLVDSDHVPSDSNEQPFNPASSVQSMVESSSSGSSVLQEPTACAQLLNNHHYQHLTKGTDTDLFTMQENGGKPPLSGIQLAVRKSTEDYCFLDWNWPIIRKVSFWSVVSLLLACMSVVITLVAKLPSTCNPPHGWWQGTIFYEIFPASFKDSNSDGLGDLRGLASKTSYLESLGVRAVRLNSIFLSEDYPERFDRILNLTEIHPYLGTLEDFHFTVRSLHKHNISLVLDIPIQPFIRQLVLAEDQDRPVSHRRDNRVLMDEDFNENNQSELTTTETSVSSAYDSVAGNMISEVLSFWLRAGVDGFYLKGLEHLVDNKNFASYVREWRRVVDRYNGGDDEEKILMCSLDVINALDPDTDMEKLNAVLNRMDLVDVYLDLFGNGTNSIKEHVDAVTEGLLYQKPGYPWIHWHIGSVDTKRLSSHMHTIDGNLAALLFHLMLPGTPSIFYGDEIGLLDYTAPQGEHHDLHHPPQLVPMHWNSNPRGHGFTSIAVLPWIAHSSSLSFVESGKQDILRMVAKLRETSPSIYMNGVFKESMNIPNCDVRTVAGAIAILERWYPRRYSYVVVSNLSPQEQTRDLSSIYYGGEILVDQHGRAGKYIKFQSLVMHPQESFIIKLDK
ncbi:amino acid transporter heavy chain SLC3A1 [Anabrus simplex]|uniref:amino acid transporter heavy chain SLC3A1 n=1 Tax=Anabrus simplex TaxID=316456 RepID=UPI0035A2F482